MGDFSIRPPSPSSSSAQTDSTFSISSSSNSSLKPTPSRKSSGSPTAEDIARAQMSQLSMGSGATGTLVGKGRTPEQSSIDVAQSTLGVRKAPDVEQSASSALDCPSTSKPLSEEKVKKESLPATRDIFGNEKFSIKGTWDTQEANAGGRMKKIEFLAPPKSDGIVEKITVEKYIDNKMIIQIYNKVNLSCGYNYDQALEYLRLYTSIGIGKKSIEYSLTLVTDPEELQVLFKVISDTEILPKELTVKIQQDIDKCESWLNNDRTYMDYLLAFLTKNLILKPER